MISVARRAVCSAPAPRLPRARRSKCSPAPFCCRFALELVDLPCAICGTEEHEADDYLQVQPFVVGPDEHLDSDWFSEC